MGCGYSGIVLGFFVSIAEPDLHILADQVDAVSSGLVPKITIIVVVSIGIAVLLAIGLIRIVKNFPLYIMLNILYGVIFILAIFTSPEFLSISFDASGATTGALTVPFIIALALGVSTLKKDRKASEKDSFGLVAIASIGAIIAVMVMSIIKGADRITGSLDTADNIVTGSIILPFIKEIPPLMLEVAVALLPILVLFLVFQKLVFKLSRHQVARILMGMVYSFIGLVLLLTGVNAGFMQVGAIIGSALASMKNKAILPAIGFVLGFMTILAEPAVHVLTHQIEGVTSGYVKKRTVLAALSVGVGLSVALSMIKYLYRGLCFGIICCLVI
jgi:hypothetical protein